MHAYGGRTATQRSKKGPEKVLGKGSGEGGLLWVLQWTKGSEKGSQKGFWEGGFQKVPRNILGENTPKKPNTPFLVYVCPAVEFEIVI